MEAVVRTGIMAMETAVPGHRRILRLQQSGSRHTLEILTQKYRLALRLLSDESHGVG